MCISVFYALNMLKIYNILQNIFENTYCAL